MTIPVRASVYPAESGTISGTGDYDPDDTVTLVWHPASGYSQETIIGIARIGESIVWNGFQDEPVTAQASELRNFEMPIRFVPYGEPLENGDSIIIFNEHYECGRIVGNRQVAIGETFSLQFLITDGEEHTIQWWVALPSGNDYMIYEGLSLSTAMNRRTLYMYLKIDPQ